MSKAVKLLSILILTVFMGACAQLVNYYASNISVSIENITIKEKLSLDNIDMNITLNIKNDNIVPVYITGFTYNAVVGQSIVASGKNPDDNSFKVEAKSESILSLDMNLSLKRAGQEFIKAYLNNEAEFRVYGTVDVTSELGTFPLNYSKTHKLGAKPE